MITAWAFFISQLFQFEAIFEGVSDSFTDNAVDVEGWIKDNGPQFAQINFPVSQDAFIRLRRDNLAYDIAGFRIPRFDFALQRQRILLYVKWLYACQSPNFTYSSNYTD